MPEIICTTVYQFPELSDTAKENARSWYRDAAVTDDWWYAVYDDFEHICDILGVSRMWRFHPIDLMCSRRLASLQEGYQWQTECSNGGWRRRVCGAM